MAEVTEAPVQKREDDSWSSLSVQLLPFSNVAFRLRVVLRWIAGQFKESLYGSCLNFKLLFRARKQWSY